MVVFGRVINTLLRNTQRGGVRQDCQWVIKLIGCKCAVISFSSNFLARKSVYFFFICDICNTHAILFYSITSKICISVVAILTFALTLQSSPLAIFTFLILLT